jgi:predicted ATP-dependent serine protease
VSQKLTANSLIAAFAQEEWGTQQTVKTDTILDTWVGGLSPGGLSIITGHTASGKTALLHSLAQRCHSQGLRTLVIQPSGQVRPRDATVIECMTVSEIPRAIGLGQRDLQHLLPEVVLIDDMNFYSTDSELRSLPAAGSRFWMQFTKQMRERGITTVITAQQHRQPGSTASKTHRHGIPGGKGLTFAADLILSTELEATLDFRPDQLVFGILLRLVCRKHRKHPLPSSTSMAVYRTGNGWVGDSA